MTKFDKGMGVNEGVSAKLGSKRAQKSLSPRGSTLSAEPAPNFPNFFPNFLLIPAAESFHDTTNFPTPRLFPANNNRLPTMLSTISEYFSTFKPNFRGEMSDYDRGSFDGSTSTHLAYMTVNLGMLLFAAYRR